MAGEASRRRGPGPRRLPLLAIGALLVAGLAWVGWFLGRGNALPPRTIVMATGPEGGTYAVMGKAYQRRLAPYGLTVLLRPTEGDAENLALLQDPSSGVQVAFLQAGMTTEEASPGLDSLGVMFLEPIWVFRHGSPEIGLAGLEGKRLAAGGERSGTRVAVLRLFGITGLSTSSVELLALPPKDAADALLRREIDAMAMASSWESPLVRRLVAAPGISVDGFSRADAYVALDHTLEKLVLPRGVGDMRADRPPQDLNLLALKVSLVVPRELHAAVQFLLLEVASDIHGEPGVFHAARQFPVAGGVDLPLSDDARRFHRTGRPFLQRYLPYWLAVLIERLLLALIPVVGVLVPLLRVAPAVYDSVLRKRVIRLYGELKLLESELEEWVPGEATGDLKSRLDGLERRADRLRLPLRFAQTLYTLKQHIELVRRRMAGSAPPDGPPIRDADRGGPAECPAPRPPLPG